MTDWQLQRFSGSAAMHHQRELPTDGGRHVWVHDLDSATLVLGSVQPDADVDRAAASSERIAVVRRRSGGGAVLVGPDAVVWIDLVVGRDDPVWHDDVAVAAGWVGEVWSAALDDLGLPGGKVHRGGLVRTALAPVVCFAGLGPGEVFVGDQKVVGISQRRTRHGARFQCSVPLQWDAALHATLLAPGIERVLPGVDPARAVGDLAVLPLGSVDATTVVEALVAHLP